MNTIKPIVALLIILLCFGIAGEMDYQDAKRAEAWMAREASQHQAP